jgi:thiosulfate/3-mercaptopyruvate sulfurtransferase
MDKLRAHHTVIVYDDDVGCQLAEGVAERLRAAGLPDVRVLDGNWAEWEASGAPAESGPCELCPRSMAQETKP